MPSLKRLLTYVKLLQPNIEFYLFGKAELGGLDYG